MPDFRCHCDPLPAEAGSHIELCSEESNHLIAANRARLGDAVRVFDGRGTECDTRISDANKRRTILRVEAIHRLPAPRVHIALAQALPKGKLIESIIRKATEIGIQKVYPILTSRCEAKVDSKRADSKNAKWAAAALEGAKQSGNPYLVQIEPLSAFDAFLSSSGEFQLKLIASLEENAVSMKTHLARYRDANEGKSPVSAIWLIGPEGDFTPAEYRLAANAGFLPTTLGPHVMRSETAAVHAVGVLHYELYA